MPSATLRVAEVARPGRGPGRRRVLTQETLLGARSGHAGAHERDVEAFGSKKDAGDPRRSRSGGKQRKDPGDLRSCPPATPAGGCDARLLQAPGHRLEAQAPAFAVLGICERSPLTAPGNRMGGRAEAETGLADESVWEGAYVWTGGEHALSV